jgi:hypothetical protein
MNERAHPSRLALDLALIGAAGAEDAMHVAGCADCQARLKTMEAERDSFLARHPAMPARPRPARRSPLRYLAPLALAASVLLVALIFRPGGPSERAKGTTAAELWVKRGEESFVFRGQPLQEGDTLVFRYTSTRKHLTVIDAEVSGKIEVVIDQAIEPGSDRTAPSGVLLDGYRGKERVILLFSDGKLDDPLAHERGSKDVDRHEWTIERSAP